MVNEQKLRQIKLLHTAVWVVMVAAIFQILYSGWSGNISPLTWGAFGLMAFEGLALWYGKGACPLTPVARQYSDSRKANFDIYLPEWLARWNKEIFGTLLLVGVVLVVWRFFTNLS
jgi:hypothetical protein